MLIGNNPLTSHYAWQGSVPPFSPSRRLRDAKARGLKLICIDPRRTMVAQLADIHLQVRPGEDAPLLAASGISEVVHHPLTSAELAGVLSRCLAANAARQLH